MLPMSALSIGDTTLALLPWIWRNVKQIAKAMETLRAVLLEPGNALGPSCNVSRTTSRGVQHVDSNLPQIA